MKQYDWFVLAVVLVILHQGNFQKHEHIGAKICANRQFRKDRLETFKYVGNIENGVQGTTKNCSKMRIEADLEIRNWETCRFYLLIKSYKIYESVGQIDNYKLLPANDLVSRLTAHPLIFHMKNGLVTELRPSVQSIKPDVLNIQRGIISMLQVRRVQSGETIQKDDVRLLVAPYRKRVLSKDIDVKIQRDVSGKCTTKYTIHKRNGHEFVEDDVTHVDKYKDLNSCAEGHLIAHSNIHGVPYGQNKKDPILKSSSSCYYKLNKKRKVGLKQVVCDENFLVQPFSSESGAGAYVKSRTELIRVKSKKIREGDLPYENYYTTTIMYDHDHQHTSSHIPEYKKKVSDLLTQLSQKHYHKSQFNTAAIFFDLVASLRHLNLKNIMDVFEGIDMKKESERFFIFDALAQCGTPHCLNILFSVMEKFHEDAQRFMPYLAFVKEPTPELLRMLTNMHSKTKQPNVLLLLSSLVYRTCQHRNNECQEAGIIGKVVEDTEYYFLRLLGTNCLTNNPQKQQQIYYALRGIGNMGRPSKALPIISSCIQQAQHVNVSIAAIQALRRMSLSMEMKEMLLELFADMNEDVEKRIEVFLLLMKNPLREDIILGRDVANHEDESRQIKSFIASYLKGAASNRDPSKTELTNLFKEILESYPLTDFDAPSSKYSKAFLYSANLARLAGSLDGMVLFHPESFVPRTINLNLTTHMFGFSVNPFEINARMEGLELMMAKYFGDKGLFGQQHFTQMFKVPDEKLEEKRKRRSASYQSNEYDDIDAQVNMKTLSPQALISMKVFGNEIQMLTLQDLPFLNGKYDDVNVIRELYELTKGKRTTLKQNMILLEVSHSVPTMLGLPLKIGVNASAVATMDIKGKVTSSNLMFGAKKVKIHGSIHPSISIQASSLLSVECIGVGKIGTSFQANVHAGRNFHGKIDYEEGKELLVDLNADKVTTDLLNITYNMYHVITKEKHPIVGIKKRTKIAPFYVERHKCEGPEEKGAFQDVNVKFQGYFCSDEVFSSTKLFGINSCAEISFPNAYYNLSTPYFPLSGPMNLGLRNYRTDPLLKKYHISITKAGEFYDITFSTPGASNERIFTTRLGITKTDDGGVVGINFGKQRRGIILDYKFAKTTNEVEATLTSNFTNTPLKLYGEFFNKTDPTNLNRKVGAQFYGSFGEHYLKYLLFYKNTYQYWAMGSNLEYGPGKEVSADLKIQYEPQAFHLRLAHPSTNTNVVAEAIPALPSLMGRINITHGSNVDIRTYGMVDISNYEVNGHVILNPGKKKIFANGKWYPKQGKVMFNGDINGLPVSWTANLSSDSINNMIKSDVMVANGQLNKMLTWNQQKIHAFGSYGDMTSSLLAHIEKQDGRLALRTILDINGEATRFNLTATNSTDLTESCIAGNFMEMTQFAYCFTVYHSSKQSGVVLKVKTLEDIWLTPLSLMKRIDGTDSSSITAKYMNDISFQLKQNITTVQFISKILSANVHIVKSAGNMDNLQITYGYKNSTTGLSLFSQSMNIRKNIKSGQLAEFSCKTSVANQGTVSITSKKDGQLYRNDFKIIKAKNEKSTNTERDFKNNYLIPSETPFPEFTVYWNPKERKLGTISITIPQMFQYKISEKTENGLQKIFLKARLLQVPGSLLIDLAEISVSDNGEIKYQIFTANQIGQLLLPMIQSSKSGVLQNIMQQLNVGYVTFFKNLLKLKDDDFIKIQQLLTKGITEYFNSLECNKDLIKKNYIQGKITPALITEILLRILELPSFDKFTNSSEQNRNPQNYKDFLNTENMLSFVNGIIETQVKSHEYKSFVPNIQMFTSLNAIEHETLLYISNIVNVLQKISNKKLNEVTIDELLANVTKGFPSALKKKFITILRDLLKVVKTWKYDISLKVSKNIHNLLEQLQNIKFVELFDHSFLIHLKKKVVQEIKLPKHVEEAVLQFLDDSNHVSFVSKLSKFILKEFRVSGSLNNHINRLLNEKSIESYFETLARLTLQRGRIGPKKKAIFQSYLATKNINKFLQSIKDILKERYRLSDKSMELLDQLLLSEVQGKTEQTSLFNPYLLQSLGRKLLIKLKEGDFYDYIFPILNSMHPKFDTTFLESMLKTTDLQQTLHQGYKILRKLMKEQKLPNNIDVESSKVIDSLVDTIIDISLASKNNKQEVYVKLKKVILHFMDITFHKLNAILPSKWKLKLKPLFNEIRTYLMNLKPDDLTNDPSESLYKVSELILNEISTTVPDHLVSFVKEDLLTTIKIAATTTHMKKQSLMKIYKSIFAKFDAQMHFLIRLLGQFSSSQNNPFADRFINKDNKKIQYYKIYQSLWQKDGVLNENNIKQIEQLLNGLEERAFKEIVTFTGNYSLIATMNNIFNYVKSLNYTDLNTVIDSYKNIDVGQFKNLSFDALKAHITSLLEDVGQLKHGVDTIDSIIYESLPNILQTSQSIYGMMVNGFNKTFNGLITAENMIKYGFQLVHNHLKTAEENKNGLVNFIIDVLVPGIDGLIAISESADRLKRNSTFLHSKPHSANICLQSFIAKYAPTFNVNSDNIFKFMESDSDLKDLFEQYQNSSTCDLLNFVNFIKNMKKDRQVIYKLLAKVETILLKMLKEERKLQNEYKQMFKTLIVDWMTVDQDLTENGALKNLLFSMVDKWMSAFKELTMYKQIRRVIRRSINLEKYDVKSLLQKLIVKKLQEIAPTMTLDDMNNQVKIKIISIVRKMKQNINELSLNILKTIDSVKTPLLNFRFITHPYESLVSLPKLAFDEIKKKLAGNKDQILTQMRNIENKVNVLYKKSQKMLNNTSYQHKEGLKTLKELYQNTTNQQFDIILNHFDNYMKELKKLTPKTSGTIKMQLKKLNEKTKILQKQHQTLTRKFIQDIFKNASSVFGNNDLSVLNKNFLNNFSKSESIKDLQKALTFVTKGLREIIQDIAYPQLEIFANMVDGAVCDVKRNISNFYKFNKGVHSISFKSKELVKALRTYDLIRDMIIQSIIKSSEGVYGSLFYVTDINYLKQLYTQFSVMIFDQQINEISSQLKKEIQSLHKSYNLYVTYAVPSPDFIVQQTLMRYQSHIKKLALKFNKDLKIVPPTGFEKPIIRFLGFEQKPTKEMMKPIERTAYIFEKSLITFDGKAIFLPRDLHHKFNDCKFLLCRDFMWKNFTIYLYRGNFVVELQDGRIEIERYHKNKITPFSCGTPQICVICDVLQEKGTSQDVNVKNQVHIYRKVPPLFQDEDHTQDMPVQMVYTTVTKLQNTLKIQNVFGLLIYCQLDEFACNVTVAGYYHNKTLGLFGTNNVEYSDDLRMPNGQLALDLVEFVNSYQLSRDFNKCYVTDDDLRPYDMTSFNKEQKMRETCKTSIASMQIESNSLDVEARSSAFLAVCSVEKICSTLYSYKRSLLKEEYLETYPLTNCEHCKTKPVRLRYDQKPRQTVVVTIVMKLTSTMKQMGDKLKEVVEKVHYKIKSASIDVKYCLVGYHGNRIRLEPHVQTGSGGKIHLSIDGLKDAMRKLKFDGQTTDKRYGLAALKFASLIEPDSQSIRIFLLVDDDISYTSNSLQEKMEVYNLMKERSIILNTINAYKLRKNIVGRDSFGMRYHNRLATGERFSITFPRADDYIPLVKGTSGAVFTLKALRSEKFRWMKALPISMATAFNLQIEQEFSTCKECKCINCKTVNKRLCQYSL